MSALPSKYIQNLATSHHLCGEHIDPSHINLSPTSAHVTYSFVSIPLPHALQWSPSHSE